MEATGVRIEDPYRIVKLANGTEVPCHAMLIASGLSWRKLDVPGVERLHGVGVYYGAALTEAILCQNEEVYVVGGANSAGQAAVYFSQYASKVHMLVRAESLTKSMSQYLIDQIKAIPNIEVEPYTEVVEAMGEQRLECLRLRNSANGRGSNRTGERAVHLHWRLAEDGMAAGPGRDRRSRIHPFRAQPAAC